MKTIIAVSENYAGFDAGGCDVSGIVLYESRMSKKGSVIRRASIRFGEMNGIDVEEGAAQKARRLSAVYY